MRALSLFIIYILIAAAVLVGGFFAAMNTHFVTLNMPLGPSVSLPLWSIAFAAFALGVLLCLFGDIPHLLRLKVIVRLQEMKLKILQKKLKEQETETTPPEMIP